MNETDVLCPKANSLEFLNNYEKHKNDIERRSSSSGSSCHSDSSEETEISSKNETTKESNCNNQKPRRKFRSMSAGNTNELSPEEPFEVFPSLPDSVLEKMELLGDVPRDRQSEDEIEQKFVSLSLAFTIDAATIKDRCERQRRYRDQTETNLNAEIDKLIEKINCIQPLCVDAETTDILTNLLAQVEVVMRASSLAAISAERYGAVQHEERLAEAVNLMINHVNILKQQRDSARRQLQYTKRVLQDTNSSEASHQRSHALNPNSRMMTKRRASIATITEPKDPLKPNPDNRRVLRRTSDLSLRASALSRSTRPSRLELSLDLVKIREGINESEFNSLINENENESQSLNKSNELQSSQITSQHVEIDANLPLRKRIRYRVQNFVQSAEFYLTKWSNDGTLHEIFSFGALMCFSFSVIVMANLLIEIETSKRGASSS